MGDFRFSVVFVLKSHWSHLKTLPPCRTLGVQVCQRPRLNYEVNQDWTVVRSKSDLVVKKFDPEEEELYSDVF